MGDPLPGVVYERRQVLAVGLLVLQGLQGHFQLINLMGDLRFGRLARFILLSEC